MEVKIGALNDKPVTGAAVDEAVHSGGLAHYDVYVMTGREKLLYTLLAAAVIFAVGYVFYHSVLCLFLCPLALFYPKIRTREIVEKRKADLNLQFKDMLHSLSSSLIAGKSVETAFKEVLKDLAIIYPRPDTHIILEMEYMIRKIEMNETVEAVLYDFARRANLEDILNFADVFYTCKRTGGNIVEVIRNTSNIINDKIEIRQEIDTLLAARRFEQKILSAMPIGLVLLLSMSAADYIAPIFNTIAGRAAMTVALALLTGAYFLSKKIMDIRV